MKLTDKRHDYYQRMFVVMRAVLDGATYKEAGAAVGRSVEASRQLVMKGCRLARHPSRTPGASPPELARDDRSPDGLRKNRDFWLNQVKVLEREFL